MGKNKSYKVGRFKIERLLSKSNQSSIYLAQDTTLDRRVAIKFLIDESIKKDDRFAQTIQEARAVSKLQHPNIISLYEVDEYKNTPLLVFEYVEGFTLRQVIKSKKPLSVPNAMKIMSKILDGISHAHKHGIIHNDLKPGDRFFWFTSQDQIDIWHPKQLLEPIWEVATQSGEYAVLS